MSLRPWKRLCLALGLAGAAAFTSAPAGTVYLKWVEELPVLREAGGWATGVPALDAALHDFAVREVRPAVPFKLAADPVGLRRVLRLELARDADAASLAARLKALPGAVYAESAPIRTLDVVKEPSAPPRGLDEIPGDPLYPQQYFHPLIQTPAAWDRTHGEGVVVAVVDNGTDWDHPDLYANLWVNPGEDLNGNGLVDGSDWNGVDDDGNGFVDDLRGWDFYDGDPDPSPEVSQGGSYDNHGTHTAGLVAAVMNNRGVVGTAPGCDLMPIRAGYGGSIFQGLEGIIYAAHNGADIISLSWGGPGSSSYEQDIITDAGAQGALVVAAAGNENSSLPHYPAAYEGVLSVAWLNANDTKAGGSNYGAWVALGAPGTSILSLFPSSSYGTSSGTSMATPMVAGVAALVRAFHPSWSVDQVLTQLVSTADDISLKNPAYPGMLGAGRINAYRAVTETAPGFAILDMSAEEVGGDQDGRVDPGENARLSLTLKNYGSATSGVQVVLLGSLPEVQVVQGIWDIPQLAAGGTATNPAGTFEVSLSPFTLSNREIPLTFTVSAENFYTTTLSAPLAVDPAFAHHDTGNVVFTVTDFGVFGYNDYTNTLNPYIGRGFRFPATGSNALFHGSLMAGVSTARVSDCAYGDNFALRYDWTTATGGEITMGPGEAADQQGFAVYQDSGAGNEQIGLQVTQESYAWKSPPGDDFVLLSFLVKNVSPRDLDSLYLGLYLDWDVADLDSNEAGWNPDLRLGYTFNDQVVTPNTRYYGSCLLSHDPASYRVINHNALGNAVLTDSLKYIYMSQGMVTTSGPTSADYSSLLSAGPFSLVSGDSVMVGFAVLGGENLDDLRANAAVAIQYWEGIPASGPAPAALTAPPGVFSLSGAFPQPANGELTVDFVLPGAGRVAFDLVDVLGRAVRLHEGEYSAGGTYRVTLPHREIASGVYFLRGTSPYGNFARKILWLK